MLTILISVLLVIGASFVVLGAYGMAKLPDFFTRLHAPTKATTLGVGSIAIASMLDQAARGESVLTPLLLFLFLFISAPVSAYLLARCADEEQRRNE